MQKYLLLLFLLGSISLQAQVEKDQNVQTVQKNKKDKNDPIVDQDDLLRDLVISDDHIVQGSNCVGLDCVNGENFGFDTGRFKENNLRLHFDDTSNSASFPSNDWRISINDSSNGGSNYFSIDDATAGTSPFRVLAGAGNNALYVSNNGGNVGLGTSNPVLELHVTDGDTPALRLEQNGTVGWTPHTWDVAGNETNFFVRDVTNSSKIPFKILPGSPDNQLVVTSTGIGIGTKTPTNKLDVMGDVGISGQIFGISDARLKVNVSSIGNAMEIINALDGKSYLFDTDNFPQSNLPEGNHYGLLAQDVEQVLGGLVKEQNMRIVDKDGVVDYYRGVNYQELIPILVNAVKEQNAKIEDYETRQAALEDKQAQMEAQIAKMTKALETLDK